METLATRLKKMPAPELRGYITQLVNLSRSCPFEKENGGLMAHVIKDSMNHFAIEVKRGPKQSNNQ